MGRVCLLVCSHSSAVARRRADRSGLRANPGSRQLRRRLPRPAQRRSLGDRPARPQPPIRRSSRSTASPVTTPARRPAACRSTDANPADAAAHAEVWEKVVDEAARRHDAAAGHAASRRRRRSTPSRRAREDASTIARSRSPDPGHKPVHRLNRTEYGNAVRDLLDLEVDVTESAAGRR